MKVSKFQSFKRFKTLILLTQNPWSLHCNLETLKP